MVKYLINKFRLLKNLYKNIQRSMCIFNFWMDTFKIYSLTTLMFLINLNRTKYNFTKVLQIVFLPYPVKNLLVLSGVEFFLNFAQKYIFKRF